MNVFRPAQIENPFLKDLDVRNDQTLRICADYTKLFAPTVHGFYPLLCRRVYVDFFEEIQVVLLLDAWIAYM